jgi:hypothetical protein
MPGRVTLAKRSHGDRMQISISQLPHPT